MKKLQTIFMASCCMVLLALMGLRAQAQVTKEFTENNTWTVPEHVYSVQIECWGGGGAGGYATSFSVRGSAGGGGGAYAKAVVNVNAGDVLNVYVGKGASQANANTVAPGGNTYVEKLSEVLVNAGGGQSVPTNSLDGGLGGQVLVGVGTPGSNGGAGSTGAWCRSGAGGQGAEASLTGKTGAGGASVTSHTFGSDGRNGSIYGGGGSGGASGLGDASGGNGADGYVLITYYVCDVNAGTIAEDKWVCTTEGDTTIIINDVTAATPAGGQYAWETSTDGNAWTAVADANAAQYTVVNTTGMFRRAYTTEHCPAFYSNTVTVTRPSDIDPGTIAVEGTTDLVFNVCKGSDFSKNLTAGTTYPTVWQTSTDGTTWSDVASVSPLTLENVQNDVYVRYLADYTETCQIPSNNMITIKAHNIPEVTNIAAPTDLCPDLTSFEVTASVTADGAIDTYTWTGVDANTDEVATINATAPACNHTYEYSLTVKDEYGCESAVKTGSFTTKNLTAITVEDDITTDAIPAGSCMYTIPDLTDVVNTAVTSECGVTVLSQTPAANTSVAVGTTTDVVVAVEDACGNTLDVHVAVNAPAAPVVTLSSDATDNVICHGEAVNFTATVTLAREDMSIASIEWSDNVTPSETGLEAVAPAATTASALLPVANEYRVTVKASDGCIAQDQLTVTTLPKADTISGRTAEICAPNGYEFKPAGVPANTTYTWTVTANTDETNNAADQTTAQTNFNVNSLTNTTLAYQTVTYKVTPTTTTTVNEQEYSCVGEDFNIILTVKPSITTEGAITDFTNPDVEITLWYGACDTAYYVQEPTYVNHIAEYDGEIVLSNDKATAVNEGTILGRIAPGTYTIVWRLTDPCGNYVEYPQKFIVSYPACGTELTATDVDGNTYETVRIGCECWTKSNLRTTTGATFANVYTAAEVPAVDEATFGLLYTWYSAMGVAENDNTAVPTVLNATGSNYPYVQGICPEGWAVPSAAAYQQIAADANALKSTDANAWLPGSTATNTTGFSAVGAGYYDASSERYVNMLGETYYWSAETTSVVNGTCCVLTQTCPQGIITDKLKGQGFSVRCVKRAN